MKHFIFIFFFLLASHLAFGQDPLTEIRRLYKKTQDNKTSYTKKSLDDFENSSEGGELTGYFEKENLKLIEINYYGHMGKSVNEIYVNDSLIYFIFVQDYSYNAPSTSNQYDNSKTKVKENRYYLWNQDMISWVDPSGNIIDPNSEEFKKEKEEILKWVEETIDNFKQ